MSATVGKIQRTGAGAFSAYLAGSIQADAEQRVGSYYAAAADSQRTAWRVMGLDRVAERLGVRSGDRLDQAVLERMISGRDVAGHRLLDPTPQMLAKLGRELGREVSVADLDEWSGLFRAGLSAQLLDEFSQAQVEAIDVVLAGGSLGSGGTRSRLHSLGVLVGHELSMADVVAISREGGEFAKEAQAVLASTEPRGAEVAAYDLTFSAPKSVSVLWAMAAGQPGREELAAALERAHMEASREALEWIAEQMRVRRGKEGAVLAEGSGLVAAQVLQTMSRDLDPHLHTHTVISTAVVGADGRVTRMDGEQLYHASQLAGRVYQMRLREFVGQIAPDLAWRELGNGLAELSAMPEELVRAMSKRSNAIKHDLASLAAEGRKLEARISAHRERYELAVSNVEALGAAASAEDRRMAGEVERALKWAQVSGNTAKAKSLSWARTRTAKAEPDERELYAAVIAEAAAVGVSVDGLLAAAAAVREQQRGALPVLDARLAGLLAEWAGSPDRFELPLSGGSRGGREDRLLAGARELLAEVVPASAGTDARRRAGVELRHQFEEGGAAALAVREGFVARFGEEEGLVKAKAWLREFRRSAATEWLDTRDLGEVARAASDQLARESSRFSERALFERVVDLLGAGGTVEQAQEAVRVAHSEVAELQARRHETSWVRRDEGAVFTTLGVIRQEADLQRVWRQMAAREDWNPADPAVVARVAEDRTLTAEQLDFVAAATLAGSQVLAVEGVAGAGKSWALGAVADVLREQGLLTVGVATSAQAAANLASGSGFSSAASLARFMANLERGRIVVGLPEDLDRQRAALDADDRAFHAWRKAGEQALGAGSAFMGLGEERFQAEAERRSAELAERRATLTQTIEDREAAAQARVDRAVEQLRADGRARFAAEAAVRRASERVAGLAAAVEAAKDPGERERASGRLREAQVALSAAEGEQLRAEASVEAARVELAAADLALGQSVSVAEARGRLTLVLDEAGMTSGIDIHAVARAARENDWKLLVVGDSHQLQPIERSGFTLVKQAGGFVELSETVRAREQWERDAQVLMRNADSLEAAERVADAYMERGRVSLIDHEKVVQAWPELEAATNTTAGKRQLAIEEAVGQWEEAVLRDGERDVLLVTPDLRLMSQLNTAVQEKVREAVDAREEKARVERRLDALESRDGRTLSREERGVRDELRARLEALDERIGATPVVDFTQGLDLGTRGGRAESTRVHVGEPVVVLNNEGTEVRNGMKGRLDALRTLEDGRVEVTLSLPLGADGRWATRSVVVQPGESAGEVLSVGYAQNVHKAQGATHEVAIAVADTKTSQEALYVAMSRGKRSNSLVFVPLDDERDAKEQLVFALSNSQRKETAMELLMASESEQAEATLRRALGQEPGALDEQAREGLAAELRKENARVAARAAVRREESRGVLDAAMEERVRREQEEQRKAQRGMGHDLSQGRARSR